MNDGSISDALTEIFLWIHYAALAGFDAMTMKLRALSI
jgi:hypothetical protein